MTPDLTLPLDAYTDAGLLLTTEEMRARVFAANLAAFLQRATYAELAHVIGALQAECVCRGVQVSVPLGEAQTRVEAAGERAGR